MSDPAPNSSGPAEIKSALKEMIVRELNLADVSPGEIGDAEPLFGDRFGLDSIDAVELVFQVKTHFGVEIRNMKEGREVLQTVDALAAFILASRRNA